MRIKSINRTPTPHSRIGSEKVIRHVFAKRRGTSALGTKFKKGDPIFHMFSTRSTGEVFILTPAEMASLLKTKPVQWENKYSDYRNRYARAKTREERIKISAEWLQK